ncbi:MAG: DUF4157 domain-containing protein [Bacteroidota bacterium]
MKASLEYSNDPKAQRKTQQEVAGSQESITITDDRPSTVYQRRLKNDIEESKANTNSSIQRKPNQTGLPDQLKSGIENLSGYAMDDVNVHYNSARPAQFNALAYAQGTNIHLGPGQEQHLPHEAWHVVQQKQGRVRPTFQFKRGVKINDDAGLEKEADVMGDKAMRLKTDNPAQLKESNTANGPIQRKIGFEFQAYDSVTFNSNHYDAGMGTTEENELARADGFKIEGDYGNSFDELEIITVAVDETDPGRRRLEEIMTEVETFTKGIRHEQQVTNLHPGSLAWLPSYISGGVTFPTTTLFFDVNGSVHFHPQATVGVKFEKIHYLIDRLTKAPFRKGKGRTYKRLGTRAYYKTYLGKLLDKPLTKYTNTIGWSQKEDQKPFRSAWANGLKKAKEFGQRVNASEKTISFMAILYGMAEASGSGAINPEDSSVIKYYMPFLFRMGLLPFYNSLNPGEIAVINGIPPAIKNQLIVPKVPDGLNRNQMTIRNLLNLLSNGQDLQSIWPTALDGYGQTNRTGEFGMTNTSDIGDSETEQNRAGAIIELRKLRNDVPPSKLKPFALAVFDLVRTINVED